MKLEKLVARDLQTLGYLLLKTESLAVTILLWMDATPIARDVVSLLNNNSLLLPTTTFIFFVFSENTTGISFTTIGL